MGGHRDADYGESDLSQLERGSVVSGRGARVRTDIRSTSPNRASGGQSSLVEVADFLSEGHGPQHEALLRLLGNVQMDWTVELHPDDSDDAKMIDLPNFEAVLACIKEHKEKGFPGTLGVHARVQPTDEERAAVIVAGGMPMWADHGLGSD
jgi:hypothetical protein